MVVGATVAQCELGSYITNIKSDTCKPTRDANAPNINAVSGNLVKGYESALSNAAAELSALNVEYTGLSSSATNISATLTTDIAELEARAATIRKEIDALDRETEAASAAFEANTDPLHGGTGAAFKTLQEWIIFLLFVTYAFAAIACITYIGYTNNWNKKTLATSIIAAGILSLVLFSILKAVA